MLESIGHDLATVKQLLLLLTKLPPAPLVSGLVPSFPQFSPQGQRNKTSRNLKPDCVTGSEFFRGSFWH